MQKKIYYYDTDCGGVVYYANYLEYLEEARTELLAQRGISVKELIGQDVLFVVARQEIDYKSPAFYQDTLKIDTQIIKVGAARIEFIYEIKNQDGKVISTARTILVCVDKDLKPQAVPEAIREKIVPNEIAKIN